MSQILDKKSKFREAIGTSYSSNISHTSKSGIGSCNQNYYDNTYVNPSDITWKVQDNVIDYQGSSWEVQKLTTTVDPNMSHLRNDTFLTNELILNTPPPNSEQYELLVKTEPKNRLDKDLINTKLPYNIKIQKNKTLIYEIAVAGYNPKDISVDIIDTGIQIEVKPFKDDDLIGDDDDQFNFIAKGLRLNEEKFNIYIDKELYDLTKTQASIDNGLLIIKVEAIRLTQKVKIKVSNKSKKEDLI